MLSDRVAAELRKLCDQVAPFPDEEARRLVIAQLGSGLSLGRCVAAASLGQARHPNTRLTQKSRIPAFRDAQVYCIERNGRQYALKVQRPGLNRALAMDVVILPLGGSMDQVRSLIGSSIRPRTWLQHQSSSESINVDKLVQEASWCPRDRALSCECCMHVCVCVCLFVCLFVSCSCV